MPKLQRKIGIFGTVVGGFIERHIGKASSFGDDIVVFDSRKQEIFFRKIFERV